jgi:hypothetical protein
MTRSFRSDKQDFSSHWTYSARRTKEGGRKVGRKEEKNESGKEEVKEVVMKGKKKSGKGGRKEGWRERSSEGGKEGKWEGRKEGGKELYILAFEGADLSANDFNSEAHFLGNLVIRLNKANSGRMELQCMNKYAEAPHAFAVACTKKGDSPDVAIKC